MTCRVRTIGVAATDLSISATAGISERTSVCIDNRTGRRTPSVVDAAPHIFDAETFALETPIDVVDLADCSILWLEIASTEVRQIHDATTQRKSVDFD